MKSTLKHNRRNFLAKRVFRGKSRRGFTLLELMVAMAITALIVTVLVSITGVALDAWRRSRAQVRASRQAKAALETMAKDFESLLVRGGNPYQWLVARVEPELAGGGGGLGGPTDNQMPNAAQIVFFNSATDRYDGELGGNKDEGGDVTAIGYRLIYRDPILDQNDGQGSYPVFALYRHLINPKPTFDKLLGKSDLIDAYKNFQRDDYKPENFVVENIFGLTVTFVIEYEDSKKPGVMKTKRISIMKNGTGSGSVREFIIAGDGLKMTGGGGGKDLASGRVVGIDLSITILSDFGLQQAAKTSIPTDKIIREHGYHYSKSVIVPQP
jgi:prepilin-type N-terminal cleavage/methylation domain-containing protein